MDKDTIVIITATLTVAEGHRLQVTMEAGQELIASAVVKEEELLFIRFRSVC